jgi:glycerophosphoryl diester phosphodiesterase
MKNAWITQRPIAHRGSWDEYIPENSIAACERAIADGHPIELDVQMLADGEMIIFHDRSCMRMTGQNDIMSHLYRTDIEQMRLHGTRVSVPFLCDALTHISGRVPIMIEMKYRGSDRKMFIRQLKKVLKDYRGMYALTSFDPFLVKLAKEHFSDILCGQNFSDHRQYGAISGWMRKIGLYCAWITARHMPDFFVCRASLLPRCWIVSVAQKNNRPLLTWAIDDGTTYQQIADVIDNEIFDQTPYRQ